MLIQNLGNVASPPPKPASNGGASVPVENAQITDKVVAHKTQQPDTTATVSKPTSAQLQGVVDDINRTMKSMNKNLEFSVDKDSNRTVVKMVDVDTGEVIRQFPSEEALAISRSIDEQLKQGMFIKQKA